MSTSRELAMIRHTDTVKSSALTAETRLFDIKYHKQTADSVSLQGSVPFLFLWGHFALRWTRHMATDDKLPAACTAFFPSNTGGHPCSNQQSVLPMCGLYHRMSRSGEMSPCCFLVIFIFVQHKHRQPDCFAETSVRFIFYITLACVWKTLVA